MIGFVVVVVAVDTNVGRSQHLGVCASCKWHALVDNRGKPALTPSNWFNTIGACSDCRVSASFYGPSFWMRLFIYNDCHIPVRKMILGRPT